MTIDIDQYNRIKTLTKKINSSSGSGVITIVDATQSPTLPAGLELISINTFVKSLKAYAKITSINESILPNFLLEDTDTDRLYKSLDVEWNSSRKQLDLLISEDSTNWELIGSVSLLNPRGYPYRMYNLQDFYTDNLAIELGDNGKLGVQVKDVGYGGLLGNDLITIHGSYLREIIYKKPKFVVSGGSGGGNSEVIFDESIDYEWSITNSSQVILAANENRKYFSIINKTDKPVFINLGTTATIGKGILLTGKGSSYQQYINSGIYQGEVSAIAIESVELCGVEAE
ncbi:MAG: hypothetical protein C6Y22_22215 [Hapalosiphonaceae cyanobacterium JJU2]|nr:MAG: hypothetical protein C6Y22_22215 [Hapalosiphonaceae cyanobacterium JJU2]